MGVVARHRTVVVGGGVGGMASAVALAVRGHDVTLFESASGLGGKLAPVFLGGRWVDAGPTVLTMRWALDELFESAGRSLSDYVTLEPAEVLARHAWQDGTRLDLYADADRSALAIREAFGAAEADSFRSFSAKVKAIYDTVEGPFLKSQRPTMGDLAKHARRFGPAAWLRIDAMRTMAASIGSAFRTPHLRQLFGRYATYIGSSPFEAPATLNLVAHVEQRGVYRVQGGMRQLAEGFANLMRELGVAVYLGRSVERIHCAGGRVSAVVCASGERFDCDAVVWNGDVSGLGCILDGVPQGRVRPTAPTDRSLSAVTWASLGSASGFPLLHHNVFFAKDSSAEFGELAALRVPGDATIYVCAQDRGDQPTPAPREAFLLIMNAPATGDDAEAWTDEVTTRCEQNALSTLARCGLILNMEAPRRTTPADFNRRYPHSGGALYGPRARGPFSALTRHSARTRVAGLYLSGGSVHPGPGVPMAALSGHLAAQRLASDLDSTRRSRPAVISGITSTP